MNTQTESNQTKQSVSLDPAANPTAAAHQRMLAEIDAVPESEVSVINLDIPLATSTALGALPEITALGPKLAKLQDFDAAALTKLGDYALALQFAHVAVLIATAPPEELTQLLQRATDARELMLADLHPLAKRGLVSADRFVGFERSLGHRGLAVDVAKLVGIMRESWPAISANSAVKAEEINEFAELADRLLITVGLREQGPAVVDALAQRRQRAFTLFTRAYEEVRRGVIYLRHHQGDADKVMPSLYAKTGRRKAEAQEVPAAPVASATVAPALAPPPPTAEAAVKPGMPGSNPFTS